MGRARLYMIVLLFSPTILEPNLLFSGPREGAGNEGAWAGPGVVVQIHRPVSHGYLMHRMRE